MYNLSMKHKKTGQKTYKNPPKKAIFSVLLDWVQTQSSRTRFGPTRIATKLQESECENYPLVDQRKKVLNLKVKNAKGEK